MAASPVNDLSMSGSGGTVIAQYLATKVAWWAAYPRILIVTASTLSTYNPETFQCTNQWEIADIETVEVSDTQNQFVLRLEKSGFRSSKLKFACSARGHLLSLLARLRRQAQGKALLYRLVNARRLHFRCIEQFANASHKLLFLQVTVSSVVFLDECGRRVQILPFLYLQKVAFSAAHDDGMVLSTAFHDRFFLCGERHECLSEIVSAANEAGVKMYKTSSSITALQLRLQNTQVLDRPSVIRFDVKKARNTSGNDDVASGSEGSDDVKKAFKKIQLILQGDAIVEMHRSMRTVIARPYSALLAIVRPDWDPRTLVLEFKQEDTLVLDVDGRDQLVTLLLLRRINKDKRTAEPLYETRNSIDSGLSMNESVSITIAMEELNANLPLDELTRSGPGQVEVVNRAMELVFEHLVTLVAALRRYGDTTSSELITSLQALVRLYHHPDACFTDDMIPRVFDAVHELILQQDVLTCYCDVPAEKQTEALADKLLEKYRFLMDSIVDVRLVRMAETSVALVKFVLNHFATKTSASQLRLSPSDNQLSHTCDGDFYDTRKRWLGELGSFLDDYRAVAEKNN
uniref:DnaJ homologue subfamily C GRV2/DNAJC13 N-terminal domain-containing protein n=1 Tax=Phytophthora ramorum TaxID=164328 RepID=H3HE64_PHYRM